MSPPLHPIDESKLPANRCENCRWWARWLKERMLGTCGHRDSAGSCTDKYETCANFEKTQAAAFLE